MPLSLPNFVLVHDALYIVVALASNGTTSTCNVAILLVSRMFLGYTIRYPLLFPLSQAQGSFSHLCVPIFLNMLPHKFDIRVVIINDPRRMILSRENPSNTFRFSKYFNFPDVLRGTHIVHKRKNIDSMSLDLVNLNICVRVPHRTTPLSILISHK
jgi:hypothetical protein